jgi:glycosyltransferase involved in cell wall biosynthesis
MIELLSNLPYKTYAGLFLCSLLAGYWLTPKVSWLARGLGIFAQIRRNTAVPSLGGWVVSIPFIIGITLLLLLKNQVSGNMYMVPLHTRGLFFGSCLAVGIGLANDILHLERLPRYFLQVLLAGLGYYYGFRVEIFPTITHPLFTIGNIALTLLWIGGFINFFDLYNRLRPSFVPFSFILITSLLFIAFYFNHYRTIVVCSLLSGSLLGVFSHDKALRPNLGSSGTFFIGFVLAVTTLQSGFSIGIYGFLFFSIGTGLFLLFISNKGPINKPHALRPEDHLQLRSLNHYRQAIDLQMEVAEDTSTTWNLLGRGAKAFGYYSLWQCSSAGAQLSKWGHSTAPPTKTYPLWHSGGHLHILAPRDETAASQALFSSLVETYDRTRAKLVLTHVQERKNNLRIFLVNRYYAGTSATGQIIEELAEDLSRVGVAVSVITGGLSYENPTPIPGKDELLNGVHIHRLPATHFGRSSSLNRIMDFIFFYLFSLLRIVKTPPSSYTHIMTFTDPPLIALSGRLAQRFKHWKFIYNVQDLYPDTALALGALHKGPVYRLCARLNIQLLRQADAIITIGESMTAHIRQQVYPTTRIEAIPNWCDADKVKPTGTLPSELRRQLHLEDVFTLIYAGNMGIAQEIDVLIEVIEAFANSEDIQFVFMGGGVRRSDLEIAARQTSNVHFVAYQNKDSLCRYLDLADMGIVTLAPAMEGLAIPTRTYTYLAAGLPLLIIADRDSELKKFADAGLGAHFTPDAAKKIIHFLNEQIGRGREDRREETRSYFIAHFERRLQTKKYWKLLREM